MGLTRRSKLVHLALVGMMVHGTLAPYSAHAQTNDELDRLFEEEEFDEPTGSFNQAPAAPNPPPDFGTNPPDSTGSFDNPPPFDPGGNTGSFSPAAPPTGGGRGNAPKNPTGTGSVDMSQAQIEDINDKNFPDVVQSFDYPNAEITDVIKAISQLTNKNFIIDPGVRGKISIVAPTQITVAEAYKAFLSALAINGFTVVPSGKFLKVKSARNAQRDSIETYSGQYYPNADVMITRIIHLKHISAEEVNKRLRILPSKDGEMTPYEPTNSLIVSDYGANIERIMKIINELDRPGFEEQLQVMPIRYAKAKDLADLVNKIINKDTGGGSAGAAPAFGAGVPRFRSRGGTQGGGTPEELSLVAPDDRTNAIIVVGNKAGIEKVRELVRKLDYKLDPAEAGGVEVYYVKYGEAEKIATTLQGIASGASSSPASSPLGGGGAFGARAAAASPLNQQSIFGGDVKITADKNTNSLVIVASKLDYEAVRVLLRKLDIPRDQVYVEAIIMEMQTSKQKDWNPTVYKFDDSGVGRVGYTRAGTLTSIINPATDAGTILGFGSKGTVDVSVNGTNFKVPNLLAFLQLIQSNTESNILSTPQILALDNEDAEIEVGDRVATSQTQTATAAGTQTGVNFENASIKLKLTPYIRPDSDVVRLKIDQSVKQPTTVSSGVGSSLASISTQLSDRSLKTNIVVNNGDTAVLGGLVRDSDKVSETKVPLLGDIPVLGWLFKSRQVTKEKINLLVFLTPKIIRNKEDSQMQLTKKTNQRIEWLKQNFDGRDPYGKTIDNFPRSASASDELDSAGAKSNREPQSYGKKRSKTKKQ